MHLLKAWFFSANLAAKTGSEDAECRAEDDKLALYHEGNY